MTLDPVHFDGIDALATRIHSDYDDSTHQQNAEDLWTYLDPLRDDGEVFYPVDELQRRRVDPQDIALTNDAYPTQHAVDSGTLNPRAFTNGLVVDVAHAAIAAVPSDLDLHRSRTLVSAVYSSDSTALLDDGWLSFDDDNSRGRVVQVSSDLERHEREAVHAYALHLSESTHLLQHLDAATDLLFLDGPLYPKGVVRWITEGEPIVRDSRNTREVVSNYTEAVDTMLSRDVPVIGFVKNMSGRQVVRRLRRKGVCPWSTDAAFFKQVLSGEDGLTCTNWFVSRFDVDRTVLSSEADWVPERNHDPEDYLPAHLYVHDARNDLMYKAEAPLGFVRDDAERDRLTRQVLKEVAIDGVPRAVRKADELARITRGQKESLVERLESRLGVREDRSYDDERWATSGRLSG